MQNSRQAYANLALATAAFAVAFAARSLISPLSHQIQADFNLDNTSIGLLIALLTLLGALTRADGTSQVVGFDGRTGALEMGVHGVLSKKMELRPQTPNR